MKKIILIPIAAIIILTSCEKEIEIDMPAYTPSIVVEGFIANGMAPIIFLIIPPTIEMCGAVFLLPHQ